MKAAETLCIVFLPPEEHIPGKNIWVTDLPKNYTPQGFDPQICFYRIFKNGKMNNFQNSSLGSTPSALFIWLKRILHNRLKN